MNEKTKLKLSILLEKNVVSTTTIEKIQLIEMYLQEKVSNIGNLDTDFMYTHLAMAIDRAEKEKQLQQDNEFIKNQLLQNEHYEEASLLLDEVSLQIRTEFNAPERTMILLHFCNIVSQRGE